MKPRRRPWPRWRGPIRPCRRRSSRTTPRLQPRSLEGCEEQEFGRASVRGSGDSDDGRLEKYIEYIQREEIPSGYAIDDGVALHFENGQLIKAVKSKPNAKVLFISKQSGVIHQRLVETQSLIQ